MSVRINSKTNSIYLHSDVDEESVSEIAFYINELNAMYEKQKQANRNLPPISPIHFHISTYGGYCVDCRMLIDIMRSSKIPIYTYCEGYAMSCGFLLFIMGDKRFVRKDSILLYHQISGGARGTFQECKENMEYMKDTEKWAEGIVLERTKIPESKLTQVRERKIDWYIYTDEALRLGIATNRL